jgi:hypothetical protein
MPQICFWMLWLLLLGLQPVAAFEIQAVAGAQFWQLRPEAEPVKLKTVAHGIQCLFRCPLTPDLRLFYAADNEDWYSYHILTGQSQRLFDHRRFARGFPEPIAMPLADGRFYVRLQLPHYAQIYRLRAEQSPQLVLNRPDLYDFQPLPQGGFVFVTWNGHGRESAEFTDFIPGRKMQLWHQPVSGKLRKLGAFDTVIALAVLARGQQVVFATPGLSGWRLMRLDLNTQQFWQMAHIPKQTDFGGPPTLVTWPELDWVVYESPLRSPATHRGPHQLVRQRIGSVPETWLETDDTNLSKSWSPQGYFSRMHTFRETDQQGETHQVDLLECWDVRSGLVVARFPYDVNQFYPQRLICRQTPA